MSRRTVYAIPAEQRTRFELLVESLAPPSSTVGSPSSVETDSLRRSAVLLDPAVLKKRGVPIARTDQAPGELVVHFAGAYHCSFSRGIGCFEAVCVSLQNFQSSGSGKDGLPMVHAGPMVKLEKGAAATADTAGSQGTVRAQTGGATVASASSNGVGGLPAMHKMWQQQQQQQQQQPFQQPFQQLQQQGWVPSTSGALNGGNDTRGGVQGASAARSGGVGMYLGSDGGARSGQVDSPEAWQYHQGGAGWQGMRGGARGAQYMDSSNSGSPMGEASPGGARGREESPSQSPYSASPMINSPGDAGLDDGRLETEASKAGLVHPGEPRSLIRRRRKKRLDEGAGQVGGANGERGVVEEKNKNCHFCEHAPKRCSIFSCLSPSCDQMFCENCCKRHIGRPTGFLGQQDANKCDWRCPICTLDCCCVRGTCMRDHMHCKRYRRMVVKGKGNKAANNSAAVSLSGDRVTGADGVNGIGEGALKNNKRKSRGGQHGKGVEGASRAHKLVHMAGHQPAQQRAPSPTLAFGDHMGQQAHGFNLPTPSGNMPTPGNPWSSVMPFTPMSMVGTPGGGLLTVGTPHCDGATPFPGTPRDYAGLAVGTPYMEEQPRDCTPGPANCSWFDTLFGGATNQAVPGTQQHQYQHLAMMAQVQDQMRLAQAAAPGGRVTQQHMVMPGHKMNRGEVGHENAGHQAGHPGVHGHMHESMATYGGTPLALYHARAARVVARPKRHFWGWCSGAAA